MLRLEVVRPSRNTEPMDVIWMSMCLTNISPSSWRTMLSWRRSELHTPRVTFSLEKSRQYSSKSCKILLKDFKMLAKKLPRKMLNTTCQFARSRRCPPSGSLRVPNLLPKPVSPFSPIVLATCRQHLCRLQLTLLALISRLRS